MIDDKLLELVIRYKMSDFMQGQNGKNTDWGNNLDDRVEAYKQAFADEGWHEKRPHACFKANNAMTGQEWYERFEKELMKELTKKPPKDIIVVPGWTQKDAKNLFIAMGIEKAAKRASGLK